MRYDERLVVKVAMLYYLRDLDQDEIAHRLNLSRQSVSRHLKRARESGIVRFTINSPNEITFAELELELETAFDLKAAVIAPVNVNVDDLIKDAIGKYAAGFIEQSVRDGDVFGVSWSSTVLACAQNLKNNGVKDLTICQLNGSMDVADFSTRAEFIISKMAAVFKAKTISLAVPMLVDSPEILNSIMADTRIRNSFETAQRASVGVFGIGSINQKSSLYQTGYMSQRILDELRERRAVGDIAGHFFDIHGEICDQLLESRTLAVPKETFRSMRLSIALAGGEHKLEAIEGALAGKWCNALVTDETTAQSLLRRRNAKASTALGA
ncbi:MAG TPA: sugar-binding transcriptional regulator [Rectinemataceae bacterium]|nr:sugar-binding transcriptional regulator [Rectinemataceae bacterium]